MHLCTSTAAVPPLQLSIGSHALQVVQSTKLFDVKEEGQLNCQQHVSLTVKVTQACKIYMLLRLRSLGKPKAGLRRVCTSFIFTKLIHASPAGSSSPILDQQQTFGRVQKRTRIVILGPDPRHCDVMSPDAKLPPRTIRHHNRRRALQASRTHRYRLIAILTIVCEKKTKNPQ